MTQFDDEGGAEDMPPPPNEATGVTFSVGDIVSAIDRRSLGEVLVVEPTRVRVRFMDQHTGGTTEQFFAPATLKLVKRKSAARILTLLTYEQLQQIPPSEWLIREVARRRELAAIFGPPGSLKTFVALDIALSVATGMRWAGRECAQGVVLYIAAEGLYSIQARTKAWVQQYVDRAPIDAALAANLLVLGDAVSFLEPEFELLVQALTDKKIALIVVDTMARCMAGGDENNAGDMGQMIYACGRLQKLTDATVLLVHHSNKSDARSERGSSALRGACDAMLATVLESGRHDAVRVVCEKQKESAQFDDMAFELEVVEIGFDEHGAPRRSGRLLFKGEAAHEDGGGTETDHRDPDEVIQHTLAESFFEDGASGTELEKACGLPRSTYYRRRKALVEEGKVERKKGAHGFRFMLTNKSSHYQEPQSPSPSPTSPTQSHGTEQDSDRQSQSQSHSPPLGGDGNETETDNGPAASTKKPKPPRRKGGE